KVIFVVVSGTTLTHTNIFILKNYIKIEVQRYKKMT
ncbi:MAG: hypothetical protein ACI9GO_001050, partial [Bacteroidia bacterium]